LFVRLSKVEQQMAKIPFRLRLAQTVCHYLPPLITGKIRALIYSQKKASEIEKIKTEILLAWLCTPKKNQHMLKKIQEKTLILAELLPAFYPLNSIIDN
jgi:hypothetical protein